jgi:transcriptional regulator with XRE-family HTH domain
MLVYVTANLPDRPSDLVARNIRALRTQHGWTAGYLAALCMEDGAPEITQSVIANIETGRRDTQGRRRRSVTVDELVVLARVFRVQPAVLLEDGSSTGGELAMSLLSALHGTPQVRPHEEAAVVEVSREDGREMLDRAAREALGISGDEFLSKWDAGDYADADDQAVTRVAMLIPFARCLLLPHRRPA